MRGLPYRCLLPSNDARTSTLSRRSRCRCADSGRRHQAWNPLGATSIARHIGLVRKEAFSAAIQASFTAGASRRKAAAFFRISRSVRSSRFSFRTLVKMLGLF